MIGVERISSSRRGSLWVALFLSVAAAPSSAGAAEFSGVCPVLGETQPQPPLPAPLAVPQQPIEVSVQGKVYPICAVYMSVAESATEVPPDVFPVLPPNDILYPDLSQQPWFLAAGNNGLDGAKAFAEALIATEEWQTNGAANWLLNPNPTQNPNDSAMESAYFLWRDPVGRFDKGESVFLRRQGRSGSTWAIQTSNQLDPQERYWYWVLDAPTGLETVPGPLPLAGVGAALAWSRRLRRRMAFIR
jgi:hypothetical protein